MSTNLGDRMQPVLIPIPKPRRNERRQGIKDEIYSRAWRRWMKDEELTSELNATAKQMARLDKYVEEERRLAVDP